ncbi:MAG: 2'-5' RNA ligase family protein [Sphingomonas sp.]|uniref:2'-5' RNA ligase family protein n=1 Tax=Sphingomonas sp. TaxID=28214 RepID=UPI00356A5F34
MQSLDVHPHPHGFGIVADWPAKSIHRESLTRLAGRNMEQKRNIVESIRTPAMLRRYCDRLLFLLRPPTPVAQHIDAECRILDLGKRVRTDYLHITLCKLDFLPRLPFWAVPLMQEIGASVAAPPFRIAVDRMTGGPDSVMLRPSERIAALFDLQARLAAAIGRVDRLRGHPYRFNPHITLFHRKGEPFEWQVDPISWQVEDLLLVHSRVGLTEHIILDRWPLVGGLSGQGRQRPVDRLLPLALQERVGLGEMPATEKAVMRR